MDIPIEAVGQYFDYLNTQGYFSFALSIVILVFIFVSISSLIDKRKTKIYREDLTNLYVAGKIKQIAGKDGIDLDKELKDFRIFDKKMNCSFKDLDNVVEDELKEKIQEDFEEAKSKTKK